MWGDLDTVSGATHQAIPPDSCGPTGLANEGAATRGRGNGEID